MFRYCTFLKTLSRAETRDFTAQMTRKVKRVLAPLKGELSGTK